MHKLLSITIKALPDCDPDTSYLKQEGFEDRLYQYKNELFEFIGIKAEATIIGEKSQMLQFISSPGLWGIESDSDKSHLKEVAENEIESLKGELASLGVEWNEELVASAIEKCSFLS